MKLKHLISMMLLALMFNTSKAQVWYPEGVFLNGEPTMMTIDNQVITIGRSAIDATNSYWTVSISDGKTWSKLPQLVLSRTAEITEIKKYQGMVYVAGNFTFDGGKYNGVVRFNGVSWQGLALFYRPNVTQAVVTTMTTFQGALIIGGNFQTINSDTMPYLAKFNGLKFSKGFDCKGCEPDYNVTDLSSNDSVLAIGGLFSTINRHKSKFVYNFYSDGSSDTFLNSPKTIDELTLSGKTVFGVGGAFKDKHLYKFEKSSYVEIKSNLDSVYNINEMLVYDGKLVICGVFSLVSSPVIRNRIAWRDANGNWQDISNNFKVPTYIASGRGLLFALGNAKEPVSIWNPNRFVMRFYPGMALVKTKAFIDANNDCNWDPGEQPAPKQYVKLPFTNKGVYTNAEGLTEFMVPNSISNTLRFVVRPFRNYIRSNCADTAISKTFNPGQFMDSIQFPLKLVPNINDIRVNISSPKGKLVLKNKRVQYVIGYENVGSNAISGTIRLRKSKFFTSEVSLPLQKTIDDSTFEWSYSNLQPGESKVIVYSGLPSTSEFDNSFRFSAAVASSISSGTSNFSDDDYDSIPQEVESSIKAFRKDVYPTPILGDSITYLSYDDRDLRYNIAFNNFSTDTVFYAVVIDTLDINLDMSYIQETGSNKSYYTELQTDPNNQYRGIIIWHFPNIKLTPNPTMDYENPNSGAYIGFKVNTKPLSSGYMLKNIASIYYDNNYAGSTNAVYCTLKLSDIHAPEDNSHLMLYPNPGTGAFSLMGRLNLGDVVSIYSANGQMVYQTSVDNETGMININSGLSQGVYLVQVQTTRGLISKKLIIE